MVAMCSAHLHHHLGYYYSFKFPHLNPLKCLLLLINVTLLIVIISNFVTNLSLLFKYLVATNRGWRYFWHHIIFTITFFPYSKQ